jgi:ubiquinone/menaquinone biosynthesis C-methylase UbiE
MKTNSPKPISRLHARRVVLRAVAVAATIIVLAVGAVHALQPQPSDSSALTPTLSQREREAAEQTPKSNAPKSDPPKAAAESNIPPPLTHYQGREIATTMHYLGAPWLTRESRQREEDCTTLLTALKVEAGQTVCDLGCGNGFYTLPLARLVGEKGSVLAVDIQPEMLRLLEDRAKKERVSNVRTILGTLVDPRLEPASIDLILLVDVYHEFSHPEHMLRAMHKALKPKGRMALVEFRAEDPKVPIKPLHKMSKEQILKEIPPNGFRLVEEFDKLPWQHLMFFEKAEGEAKAEGGKPKAESGRRNEAHD